MSSRFYTTIKVGATRSKTPEGFLVCEGVPVARTGEMVYAAAELPGAPITPDANGFFVVERNEEDVFRPETMASLNGKPLTNQHPDEDVAPHNWRDLAEGIWINPRRGEGGLLLADLIVTHDAAIRDLENSPDAEVSAGYDADYEEISPGRGRQTNIIFNHVARVPRGRCGHRCSIGDKEMPKVKRSWRDRILTAFKAKDEEALHEELDKAEEEMGGDDNDKEVHVHVHHNTGQPAKAEPEPKPEPAKDDDSELSSRIDALESEIKDIRSSIAKILTYVGEDDTGEESDEEEEDEPRQRTGDSRLFQDVLARAELLVPGMSVPTHDRRAGAKKTADTLCALRKKALRVAYGTHDGAALIQPLLRQRSLDTLSCAAATVVFDTAAEIKRAQNNARTPGTSGRTTDAKALPSLAEVNKMNQDFWRAK